jgi:hypothetical protein
MWLVYVQVYKRKTNLLANITLPKLRCTCIQFRSVPDLDLHGSAMPLAGSGSALRMDPDLVFTGTKLTRII